MEIYHHAQFLKNYRKRILPHKKLVQKTKTRINLFSQNPNDKGLKNHPLKGKKKTYQAFSISGDYRVIYQWIGKNKVLLMNIGTHNQVY